jgi:23S rRNA C2498 (ribose-2'-O)-methylase RlmM
VDGKALTPDVNLSSVFAREYGLQVGKVNIQDSRSVSELLQSIRTTMASLYPSRTFRIHASEREIHPPGEEPMSFQKGAWTRSLREALAGADQNVFAGALERAQAGEWVFDWVMIEENQAWVLLYEMGPDHTGFPGGMLPSQLPEGAPSRAYLKVSQSAELWNIPFQKGQKVLELGASPGGMSFALLERGLEVWGVDPGAIDESVMKWPGGRFHHRRFRSEELRVGDVPGGVDWLVVDMNIPPDRMVSELERIWEIFGSKAQGAIVVVKLNEDLYAEQLPSILEALKRIGFARVRMKQLSANRKEVTFYGRTARGMVVK